MIVLGRDHDHAITRLNGRTQGAHRFRRVLAIVILGVERQPVQGENVERSLGRKRVLKAAKHRGAVGSPAQAAGETEKAELGHRAQFQMAWISVRDPTNITTAPVSSSKFDFSIRLTIALQLLERFRLWVKLRNTQHEQMSSALLPRTDIGLAHPKHCADRTLWNYDAAKHVLISFV